MHQKFRVQAKVGVVEAVRHDGVEAAEIHGKEPPEPGAESGDRIVTNVALPADAAIFSEGSVPNGLLAVQGVHWRSRAWACQSSRIVLMQEGKVALATPWHDGEWLGDSILSDEHAGAGLPATASA